MPKFNCIWCGNENHLDAFGYGGSYRGKLTCRHCGAMHDATMEAQELLRLALAGFDVVRLPVAVPEAIKEDYDEAYRCSTVRAFRAVAALCRRALESGLEGKGATGKTIHDKIECLKGKGIITSDLASLAHGIRFFSNYGAHPQQDQLKKVTELEAKTTFSLTGQLLARLFE